MKWNWYIHIATSKVGSLTRRPSKFFVRSEGPLPERQGASKSKNFEAIPKQIQNLVLGERESFRNSSILSDLILEIWSHLRSANYGALAPPKIQVLKLFGYTVFKTFIQHYNDFRNKKKSLFGAKQYSKIVVDLGKLPESKV